jgi:hypothetical protein
MPERAARATHEKMRIPSAGPSKAPVPLAQRRPGANATPQRGERNFDGQVELKCVSVAIMMNIRSLAHRDLESRANSAGRLCFPGTRRGCGEVPRPRKQKPYGNRYREALDFGFQTL